MINKQFPEISKLTSFNIDMLEVGDHLVWHTKRIFDDIIDYESYHRFKVADISKNREYIKYKQLFGFNRTEIDHISHFGQSAYPTFQCEWFILKKGDVYRRAWRQKLLGIYPEV